MKSGVSLGYGIDDEVLRYRDAGIDRFVLLRTQDADIDTLKRALDHFMNKVVANIN
ncbi:MAG TPA: hypothetical protein VL595_11245 [Pseudonocardia sp.]|nr:hypothetical protein [Pseudonocardia sp.]